MSSREQTGFAMKETWPVPGEGTFASILEKRAETDPNHKFLVWDGGNLTIEELNSASNRLANALLSMGLKKGDVVGLMLDQHAEHVIALYALAKIGLIRTSINVHSKGDYLSLLLADAKPCALIAEEAYHEVLQDALSSSPMETMIWRCGNSSANDEDLAALIAKGADTSVTGMVDPDDLLVVNYTSGTTGSPKKFARSDRVLQIGCIGCLLIGDLVAEDVLLFWEPLYHGAGSQTLLAACIEKVTLAMVPRFSASQFWDQAREFGATKIHYIGGILPILLKQPEGPNDKNHKVKIAWGAGCPADTLVEFERRFSITVHEGYGLSEVANYVCINTGGPIGSVGQVLPWFMIRTVDSESNDVPVEQIGEIVVKGKKPEYTSKSLNIVKTTTADGWIKTGDLGRFDKSGYLFFEGRKSDSLRRRGENVSAWEVERIIVQHPEIEECALIGVPSGLGAGDEDLKIFVKLMPSANLDELDLIKWCEGEMPYFQIPRYVVLTNELPKTPSQRIRKAELSKATDDCWDLQETGYALRR